jgi:hypothetical protein
MPQPLHQSRLIWCCFNLGFAIDHSSQGPNPDKPELTIENIQSFEDMEHGRIIGIFFVFNWQKNRS